MYQNPSTSFLEIVGTSLEKVVLRKTRLKFPIKKKRQIEFNFLDVIAIVKQVAHL